jgi:lambda repressor-like predicted transcriptional regulator
MPYVGRGRKYPTHTPLGQIMYERGLSVKQMDTMSGVYNRTLCDYLANRWPITKAHLALLSDALDVHPDDLIPTTPPMFESERKCRTARENARKVGKSWSTKVSTPIRID